MNNIVKTGIFFLLSVITLFVFLSGGKGVYAYLAGGDSKNNEFTVGRNEIGAEEKFDRPQPGEKTVKEPRAVNTGTVDCYVRGRILLSDSRMQPYLTYYNGEKSGLDHENWQKGADGWLYYRNILHVSETSAPVFTHISLSGEIPEEIGDCSVDVVFESVQAEGFSNAYEAFTAVSAETIKGRMDEK